MTLIAYHGKPEIKAKYIKRVQRHAKADQIIKGKYWEDGKGCAVGCTVHSDSHAAFEIELGIPRVLARLEDSIFEGLPNELAMTWPLRFLKAITPGADLSKVWPHFAVWLLTDETAGVIRHAKRDQTKKAIQDVSDLYSRLAAGETLERDLWVQARRNAAADAADAARTAFYREMSEKLLELLAACK